MTGPSWQPPNPVLPSTRHTEPSHHQTPPRGAGEQQHARRAVSDLIGQLDRQPVVPVTGWRKWFGVGPSKAEKERAADEKWLRSIWPRPIIIAVASPKGGAGKTPSSIGVGSALGLARGGGVVVWDNNELRGTLADRSFVSHDKTVVDLLARQEDLLRPDARVADVQSFLNYQPNGQCWTLNSSQEAGHQISREDFVVVREILSRFFPVLVIDTGNNEGAPNWLEAVHNADVVIVPTKWQKDHVSRALRMLETLEGQGRDVANRCVIVGTNGPGDKISAVIQNTVADWFAPLPIVEIPKDEHLAEGSEIDWPQLQPATQRAYQSGGATAAQVITRYLRS